MCEGFKQVCEGIYDLSSKCVKVFKSKCVKVSSKCVKVSSKCVKVS